MDIDVSKYPLERGYFNLIIAPKSIYIGYTTGREGIDLEGAYGEVCQFASLPEAGILNRVTGTFNSLPIYPRDEPDAPYLLVTQLFDDFTCTTANIKKE